MSMGFPFPSTLLMGKTCTYYISCFYSYMFVYCLFCCCFLLFAVFSSSDDDSIYNRGGFDENCNAKVPLYIFAIN